MADIVQLVENGQKKYIKTHVEAIEGLTTELDKKVSISSNPVSIFQTSSPTDGYVHVSSSNGVKMMTGYVTMKLARGRWKEIAVLPVWARPKMTLKLAGLPNVATTANPEQHFATVQINTEGQVMVLSWNSDVVMYDFSATYF